MNATIHVTEPLRRRRAMAALPGRDGLSELWYLLRDPTGFLQQRFARFGRVFRTRFIAPAVFAVGDEANRTLLVTRRADAPQGLGYARTPVKWVFRGSIMLQDGDEHARTRALLTPAVGRLAIHEAAERVAATWRDALAGTRPDRPEDVYQLAERTTFAVAATVLVGLPLGARTDAFRALFEDVIGGMMVPVPVRVPRGRLDRSLRARAVLVRLLTPHVLEARARPPAGLVGQLAHALGDDGRPLDPATVIEHLVLLAWAGYDTTASQSSWILHELAARPDWQATLRAELAPLGDDPSASESASVAPALESFLYEVERMYPSALFFPRVATSAIELEGHEIPRGSLVFYSPYLSHRDPATFAHPNAFDPSRWSSSRGAERASPARLVGFGGGPRVCLGKAFAKLQLRLMVRALVGAYDLEPDPLARPTIQGLPVYHPVGARVRLMPRARA